MKKTGEPEKQIVGRTAKAVKRTRKKLLAKELQNDFVPFKQWQHPSKIVVTLKTGSANKKDRAAIQRAFIEAALDQKAGTPDGLSSVQIREVTLESGKVVIEVWNKASQSFALKALKGRSYRTVVQEGCLRMVYTVPLDWGDEPHEKLMQILNRQNPGPPLGALTFVYKTRNKEGGWTVLMDVDKCGFSFFLNSRDNKMHGLLKSVRLKPAEN